MRNSPTGVVPLKLEILVSSWMINAICIRQILSLSKMIPITLARLSSIHSSADGAISKH